MLIPGAGKRMVREFAEYRPWKTWAQFDKEISKYVGQPETDRLKQYVFIPVNLNTATDEDILSIPGAGSRMVREFKEYRPWKTKEQFEKEIGKYVGAEGSGAAVAVCGDPVAARPNRLILSTDSGRPNHGLTPGTKSCFAHGQLCLPRRSRRASRQTSSTGLFHGVRQ